MTENLKPKKPRPRRRRKSRATKPKEKIPKELNPKRLEKIEGGEHIKTINKKDRDLFHAMRSVCYVQKQHYEQLGIARTRMRNFEKDGYVEAVYYRNKRNKRHEVAYTLTEKGRELVTKHIDKDDFYSSTSPNHDRKLADVYFSLDEETRQTWKTEVTLKRELTQEMYHDSNLLSLFQSEKISVTDGAYQLSNGSYQLVEIYTENYRLHHRMAKELYAATVECEMSTYRA